MIMITFKMEKIWWCLWWWCPWWWWLWSFRRWAIVDSVCKQSKTEIANVIIVAMGMVIVISMKINIMKSMMTMMMVVVVMMMMMIKGKWASVNRGCGDRNSKHELRPHSVIHMCTPSSSSPSSPISLPPLGFTFLLSSSVSYLLFIP